MDIEEMPILPYLKFIYNSSFLDNEYSSELSMYKYLKHVSNDFDVDMLEYTINDIRSFVDCLEINAPNSRPKPDLIIDPLTGFPTPESQFEFDNYKDWCTYLSFPIALFLDFNIEISYDSNQTLKERAQIIKDKIGRMHFGKNFELLIRFSEIAEVEFLKAKCKSADYQPIGINSKKPLDDKNLYSFTYPNFSTNKEAINDLLKHLIKWKYVAENTDIIDFRKIFNNTPIEKKIVWTGNISELSYFIKQLHNEKKKVVNTKQKQWEVTIKCFILSDETPMDRTSLRSQKPPVSITELDKAVKLLL